MEVGQIRSSTAQDEKVRFRLSALGQHITGLNNPEAALHQLRLKRSQFNEITRRTDEAHQRSILALFSTLHEEKQRIERMPVVRTSPKKKRMWKGRWVTRDEWQQEGAQPVRYTVYWKLLQSETWRPETREGAAMTSVGEKLYLYGGASRGIYNDLWVMHMLNPRWVRTQPQGVHPEPRMGHSLAEHRGNIVTFGGVTAYNRGSQHRECLNSVKILDTEKLYWRQIDTSGVLVSMRRYHIAVVVGKHMLLHGGLNEKNAFMSDAAVLSLNKMKWKQVDIQGTGPGHIAFHCAVGVFPKGTSELPGFSLYRIPETEGPPQERVIASGIYVFGGLDANSKAHNEVLLCKTGQRPLVWSVLETKGKPPVPRFQHTMTLVKDLNILVVYGGRNDSHSGSGYTCFNDVHILNLSTLTWAEVDVHGEVPRPRCAHSAASVSTQIISFGGVDGGRYCNSDTYVLELDQKVAQDLTQDDIRRHQREAEEELQRRRMESRTQSARNTGRSVSLGAQEGLVQSSKAGDASFLDSLNKKA